ncbi:MAG: metallophosphoesterase family protein [Acidimicrobiales bacterium]
MRRLIPPSRPEIWAIEPSALQITWGDLPAGTVSIRVGAATTVIGDHPGGPGAAEVAGLRPGSEVEVELTAGPVRDRLRATTPVGPDGPELCRIATLSDLHLGSEHWGATKRMADRSDHTVPFAVRCARAALDEAVAWGADLVVIKGDAAHHQRADDFALVDDLGQRHPDLPMLIVPGNHDVDGTTVDPVPSVFPSGGRAYCRSAVATGLPGITVIAADTTVPGSGRGSVNRVADAVVDLVADAPGPYLLGLHHHLQERRVPTHYPPGVAAPASRRFLDRLADVNPRGLVTSGHTHRNRSRTHGPLLVTEVGSTRDWPGVWAGYAVHEDGIRQVIRRVTEPSALAWHEYSRRALLGVWGWWAAGPLDQRCIDHPWGGRGDAAGSRRRAGIRPRPSRRSPRRWSP